MFCPLHCSVSAGVYSVSIYDADMRLGATAGTRVALLMVGGQVRLSRGCGECSSKR